MRPSRSGITLCATGTFLVLLDAALVWRFPLRRYFPGPGIAVGIREIFGAHWHQDVRWFVTIAGMQAAGYAGALVVVGRAPVRTARRLGFGFPVLFAVLLAAMYPVLASDLFHYLASGRVYWVFHANALTVAPSHYPFPIGISYADLPSPYGPLWTLLTGPAATLSTTNPLAGLLALKALAAAAYLGCALLVYGTVRRLAPDRPRQAVVGVVAFAWNPFVVFRMVGGGHNDSVVLLFLLLAAYLLVSERWAGVVPALAAAVLVKYVAVLLLPPLLIYVVNHSRSRGSWRPIGLLTLGAVHAGVGALLVWLPFWRGLGSFALVQERSELFTSVPGLLAFQLPQWVAVADPAAWGRAIGLTAGFAIYLVVLWRLYRGSVDVERLLAVWYLATVALLVLATPVFRPWYFLWAVGFGALLPGRGWRWLGWVLAATVQFADLVEAYWEFIPWVKDSVGRMIAAPVVVQFVPLTLSVLVLLAVSRSLTLRRAPAAIGAGVRGNRLPSDAHRPSPPIAAPRQS